MNFFNPVKTWEIPQLALDDSFKEMALDGVHGNEGVALWLGLRGNGHAQVTHVVVLRGSRLVKRPDQLVIPAALVNEVTDLADELERVLVGQIHSHGRMFGTDLSYADRTFGIKVPSFLSLVAPDYALRSVTRLEDCGVHVYEPVIGFRQMSAAEIASNIKVVPRDVVPVLTVGEQ